MIAEAPPLDFSAIRFTMPSQEEMEAGAREIFDLISPFMIDRWPESVRALSFPTTLVEVSAKEMRGLYETDDMDAWRANATIVADRLDAVMNWDRFFIRMATRSPKDAVPTPITCSGRQAVDWISNSMRCMDDASTLTLAGERIFVCLREAKYMHPDGEFRCFAKGGRMLGVSRYHYDTAPEHEIPAGQILKAATEFYDEHLAAHYPDVVFDIYAPGMPDQVLIELNPYGGSDPCLFRSYDEVEKGGERLG